MTAKVLFAALVIKMVVVGVLLAQSQAPVPIPALPFPPQPRIGQPPRPIICNGTETPCDPDQPWMRGMVEKFCGVAAQLSKLRKEHRGQWVLPCKCKHTCDPSNKNAQMTDGRGWDGTCEARCDPNNCVCPHPCDT